MSERYCVDIVITPCDFEPKSWRAKAPRDAERQSAILRGVSLDRAEGFVQAWNIATIEAGRDFWAVLRRQRARAAS